MDYGHKYAEKKLVEVERKIAESYKKVSAKIKKKAKKYFEQFEDIDEPMRKKYKSGEISKKEYTDWRLKTITSGAKYGAFIKGLAKIMNRTNVDSMEKVDKAIKDGFRENLNYGAYEVCKKIDLDISFKLYNKQAVEHLLKHNPKILPEPKVNIPKDLKWNQKKMNSAIAQGIMNGDSIEKVADRLQAVTGMNRTSAIRNARTMMTSAQNAGRIMRYREAEKLGIPIMKKWEATLDHVTRDSHVDVDGEIRKLDEPFSNGLDYPGASGPPEEVYNCRCTLVSDIKGVEYDNKERFKALGNESYEEWKSKSWRYEDGKGNVRGKK